jgi:hypothetical protein
MRIVALATVLLVSPVTLADVSFSVRASSDGSFWSNSLGTDGCLYPHIHIGVFAHFTDASALASATFNLIATESFGLSSQDRTFTLSGPGLGRQPPFTLGTNVQAVFPTASGWRIDEASDSANNPALGIMCRQNGQSLANDVLLYHFTYDPSCSLTGVFVGINISEVTASVYPLTGGLPVPAPVGALSSALLTFAPGPAPLALTGMAAPLAFRRRRRTYAL